MKRILLAAAVVAAMTMGACSGNDAAQKNEADIKAKIENCTNPDSMAVYIDQAKAYAQKLVQEGKVDEAKKYLDQLQPTVDKYAPSLSSTFTTVKDAIDKLPSAGEVKEAATDSLQNAAQNIKDAATDSLNAATDRAKDAANKAAADAADKAKNAVSNTADKAKDAIDNVLKR